ncbi:MAG: hypothetical protein ACREC0_11760 [Methylocella sp.]
MSQSLCVVLIRRVDLHLEGGTRIPGIEINGFEPEIAESMQQPWRRRSGLDPYAGVTPAWRRTRPPICSRIEGPWPRHSHWPASTATQTAVIFCETPNPTKQGIDEPPMARITWQRRLDRGAIGRSDANRDYRMSACDKALRIASPERPRVGVREMDRSKSPKSSGVRGACVFGLFTWLLLGWPVAHAQQPANQPQAPTAEWSDGRAGTTPIIGMKDTYSYEPTAMVDTADQTWKVWFCGGDASRKYGDSIFYTTIDPSKKSALKPVPVLRPQNIDAAEDGRHACSPSVIRHSNINIEGGKDLYLLYYECARSFYDRSRKGAFVSLFTQICLAFSEDGIKWHKYNEELWGESGIFGKPDTNPTPVVTAAPKVLSNCKYAFTGGRHTIDMSNQECSLKNFINNYGAGHPSALTMGTDSSKQIWLYYSDSKGDWWQHGTYLAKSWDGFHFDTPVKTNIVNGASVKYYHGNFGGWSQVFVATTVIDKNNGFEISEDGIHWTPAGSFIPIGVAVDAHCPAPGAGTIVGDEGGNLSSLSVNILSGEGYLGTADRGRILGCYNASEDRSRGSTLKMYLFQGDIVAKDSVR